MVDQLRYNRVSSIHNALPHIPVKAEGFAGIISNNDTGIA